MTDTDHSPVTAAPELAPKVRTDWGRYGRRPLNVLMLIALLTAALALRNTRSPTTNHHSRAANEASSRPHHEAEREGTEPVS